MTLRDQDLPALYQAADTNSLEAQEGFLKKTSIGLVMLIVAAAAGALTYKLGSVDLMGVIAAAAFIIAVFLRLDLSSNRPERIWYEGRAAAESTKNLAWRYAVGAGPFRIDTTSPAEADELFTNRLRETLTDLRGINFVPSSAVGEHITHGMRDLRRRPLDERKTAYRVGRIEDQQRWYSAKARWNLTRARRWNGILLAIEASGAIAAVLKAAGVLELDLLGLAGAVVAAGASWLQTKQHFNLAEAYSIAAHELSAINDRISTQITEEAWARFVNDAEEAISREHTLWRASRT